MITNPLELLYCAELLVDHAYKSMVPLVMPAYRVLFVIFSFFTLLNKDPL